MLTHLELGSYIADTVREPLLVLDGTFRVMAANRAYFAAFQASPDDTIDRVLFDLGDAQWDIPELRRLLQTILPQHREITGFCVEHVLANGDRRSMIINACEIIRPLENEYLILLALYDVTDQRLAEAALAERTLELERSNRDLEQFAAIASHDLHEPLRKIRTYGDLILRSSAEQSVAQNHDYTERMVHAATRMQTLINELLALARLSSPYVVAAVDLNVTLRGVLTDLETSIADADGSVTVGILPTVTGNAVQLQQLFQNLVSNALKFRTAGTAPVISVIASAGQSRESDTSPSLVEISVRDNGIGFDQQYADKIFEPLQRLNGRSAYPGSGMGLALSRRIVERHGGTITAVSKLGEGAALSLTLPMRVPARHPATSQPGQIQ